jgi:hypothetical protein
VQFSALCTENCAGSTSTIEDAPGAKWLVSLAVAALDGTATAGTAVFVGSLLYTRMAMLAHCRSRVAAILFHQDSIGCADR